MRRYLKTFFYIFLKIKLKKYLDIKAPNSDWMTERPGRSRLGTLIGCRSISHTNSLIRLSEHILLVILNSIPAFQNATRRKIAHRFEREKTTCSFPLSTRHTISFYRSICRSSFEKCFSWKLIFQPAWCAASGPACSIRSSGFRRAERRWKRRRWSGEGFPENSIFSSIFKFAFY